MTDRPIIFSAPMVRALLDGRKTQTRRVLTPRSGIVAAHTVQRHGPTWMACEYDRRWPLRLPYAPGDRLWVREVWRSASCYDDLAPSAMGGDEPVRYEADASWQTWGWGAPLRSYGRVRQGMHMPRWASRLTLTVTDVRVQRLQEISNGDAIAEGIEPHGRAFTGYGRQGDIWMTSYNSFASLWNHIHGPAAWGANPWVVALTFIVAKGNIDGAAP